MPETQAIIKEYVDKPSLDPLYKGKITFSSIWMGVELELEVIDAKNVGLEAEKIVDVLGDFVIVKKDASLRRGFEICSRPASLEFHKEKWPKFFEQIGDNLQTSYIKKEDNEDERIVNSCGMHVHINRAPLSDLQIGKILYFIHREQNRPFIQSIAERDSNIYGAYATDLSLKDAKFERYIKLSRGLGVNLHNYNTIEIRIFKSTTKLETFMKNLEFCDALVEFTLPSKTSIGDSTNWEKFVTFVTQNEKTYSHLLKFVKEQVK